jgi:hypothetical protein
VLAPSLRQPGGEPHRLVTPPSWFARLRARQGYRIDRAERFPDPPEGGMTYANWRFGRPGLSEVRSSFHLDNDPGPASHLYLQLYDAPIDGTAQYHGVQTIGLAIFSRFTTVDLDEVRPAPGAHRVAGTDEGPYVSVRLPLALPAGAYSASVRRLEPDGDGDWFGFEVALPSDGVAGGRDVRPVGAIRFPRRRTDRPATLADGGGTWTECWDNNGPVLHPVPLWRLRLEVPVADGDLPATGATLRYSRMPNGSMVWDGRARQLVTVIGGDTRRPSRTPSSLRLA